MIAEVRAGELAREYGELFELDAKLDRLIRKIELLTHLNPRNIEKEKNSFFASKYSQEPDFKYPRPKFDPFLLQRQFFALPLERISDERIRKLYQETIYYYANIVQCIETIGTGKNFYFNSLRVYGTPTEKDVRNARYILHFADVPTGPDQERRYTALEARSYFEEFVKAYDFPLNIKFSTSIAAVAMVSNIQRSLLIKKNAKFSKDQLLTLANHEIGVHLVTTYNGLQQPLKIFSNGLPKNVETQEGLAVFSEYMGGALSLKRLKELAYRVLASDSLIKGYSFTDTFDLIHGQYKLDRDEAFTICMRAHRGGGFTKDRLYLSGLRKIYKRYQRGESMEVLLCGKVALENEGMIEYLMSLGLVRPLVHKSHSFDQNLNTDKAMGFILDNLK